MSSIGKAQITITDLNDSIVGVLSNDACTIPTDSSGNSGNYSGAASTISIYNGITDDTSNWVISATPSSGVTGSLSTATYTVSNMTVDTGYVDLIATRAGYSTITKRFSLSKNKQGATGSTGSTGASATAYWLILNTPAISKSISGVYTPTTLTATAKSQTGAGTPANYSGRFIIADSTDGVAFTDRYTSSANEATKTYTPSAGIKALRVRLYLAGGTTTLLDEQIAPIVSDGATGATGTDGITYYTWVKYADDINGNGMSDSPTDKRYLGLAYNKTTATESTIATDYSWSPLYDNVQVGGTNYYQMAFFTGANVSNCVYDSTNQWYTFLIPSGSTTSWRGIHYTLQDALMHPGKTYTLSFEAFTDSTIPLYADINNFGATTATAGNDNDIVGSRQYNCPSTIPNQWTKASITITIPSNATQDFYDNSTLGVGNSWVPSSDTTIKIRHLQIEEGNIATDWSPSPKDQVTKDQSYSGVKINDNGFSAINGSSVVTMNSTDGFKITNGSTTLVQATTGGSLTVAGAITANSGYIGGTSGFTIVSNKFYSGGKTAYNSATSGVYVGTDGIGLGNAAFYVTSAGALTATNATLTGAITANTGYIGGTSGFTITNSGTPKMYSGGKTAYNSATNGVYIGTDGIGLGAGKFYVDSNGNLTATAANITGAVTITGGSIAAATTINGTAASTLVTNASNGNIALTNLNNLQIGGTNLLLHTGMRDSTHGGQVNGWAGSGVTGDVYVNTLAGSPSGYQLYIHRTDATTNFGGVYWNCPVLTVGKTYTWSVWLRGSGTWQIGCEQNGLIIVTPSEDTFTQYTHTFVADNNQYHAFIFYTNSQGASIYAYGLKLEDGNKATTWSDAPTDYNDYANSVASGAQTNAQNYADAQYNATKALVDAWKGAEVNGTTYINGGLIETDTITAKQMAIGDFTNLVDNPNMTNWNMLNGAVIDSTTGYSSGSSYKFTSGAKEIDYLSYISVQPGQQYYYSCWYKTTSDYTPNGGLRMRSTDQEGDLVSTNFAVSTSWTQATFVFTVPAGVYHVSPRIAFAATAGTVWVDGQSIEFRRMSTGQLIVDGAISASKIQAGTLTTASGVFGDINASSITSGTLNSDRIAASSITSKQIAIGDFTNFCPNPYFIDDNGNASTQGWSQLGGVGLNGTPSISKYNAFTNQRDTFGSDFFPVKAGDQYAVQMDVSSTGTQTHNIGIGLWCQDANGNNYWPIGASHAPNNSNWDTISGRVTIPPNCIKARVWVQVDAQDTFDTWYLANVFVRHALTGSLFVDGTITGVQINGSSFYQNSGGRQTWLDANGLHSNNGSSDVYVNFSGKSPINVVSPYGNLNIDGNGLSFSASDNGAGHSYTYNTNLTYSSLHLTTTDNGYQQDTHISTQGVWIGDSDTGLVWIDDGDFDIRSNGVWRIGVHPDRLDLGGDDGNIDHIGANKPIRMNNPDIQSPNGSWKISTANDHLWLGNNVDVNINRNLAVNGGWVYNWNGLNMLAGRNDSSSGGGADTAYGAARLGAFDWNGVWYTGFAVGYDDSGARTWSDHIYDRTYGSAANMYITSSGTLGRSTSATKYKENIQYSTTQDYAERLLTLAPASWHDKAENEALARAYEQGITDADDRYNHKYYGLIAEDVANVGLTEFVSYGAPDELGNREIEGIEYSRLWTLLIPIIKDMKSTYESEIDSLKEDNQSLRDSLNDVMIRLADLEEKQGL